MYGCSWRDKRGGIEGEQQGERRDKIDERSRSQYLMDLNNHPNRSTTLQKNTPNPKTANTVQNRNISIVIARGGPSKQSAIFSGSQPTVTAPNQPRCHFQRAGRYPGPRSVSNSGQNRRQGETRVGSPPILVSVWRGFNRTEAEGLKPSLETGLGGCESVLGRFHLRRRDTGWGEMVPTGEGYPRAKGGKQSGLARLVGVSTREHPRG